MLSVIYICVSVLRTPIHALIIADLVSIDMYLKNKFKKKKKKYVFRNLGIRRVFNDCQCALPHRCLMLIVCDVHYFYHVSP